MLLIHLACQARSPPLSSQAPCLALLGSLGRPSAPPWPPHQALFSLLPFLAEVGTTQGTLKRLFWEGQALEFPRPLLLLMRM